MRTRTILRVIVGGLLTVGVFADELSDRISVERMIAPQYPRLALLAAASGRVTATVMTSPDGGVREVVVESGPALLRDAARQALLRWRFFRGTGEPRTRSLRAVFVFELNGTCELPKCNSEVEVVLPNTVIVRSEAPRAIVN